MNPEEHKLIVAKLKTEICKNNWNYLSRHPEIRALVRVVLKAVVRDQPEKVYDFIADLFSCDTLEDLTEEVNEQLKRLKSLKKDDAWTEYDGELLFAEKSESKNSVKSKYSALTTILKFSGVAHDGDGSSQLENNFVANFLGHHPAEK